MPVRPGVAIPLAEIELRASRSSGPGGQHANVTASRVEAVFDVESSEALSDEQKRRVIARLRPRVSAGGPDAPRPSPNPQPAPRRPRPRLAHAPLVSRRRPRTR